MSQFDTKNLSPVPVALRPCDLPYGLRWRDLQSAIPDFVDSGSGRRASISHEKQGLHDGDNSCIVTLQRYDDDGLQECTVFIKRTDDPKAWEAAKYRLLASRGVPTPELLVSTSRGGAEVIVLEFLPRIGIDFAAPVEVRALLELVARVNATDVDPADVEVALVVPNAEFDSQVLTALRQLELDGVLGQPAAPLFDAYRSAQDEVAATQLALSHGELYFQQIGWSTRDQHEGLVLFDLATLALRPRFTDVASILPLLALETGRPEPELFDIYLAALVQFGKPTGPRSDAMRELFLVRVASVGWTLPWLASASRDASDVDLQSELALKVSCLCDDVKKLGFVANA